VSANVARRSGTSGRRSSVWFRPLQLAAKVDGHHSVTGMRTRRSVGTASTCVGSVLTTTRELVRLFGHEATLRQAVTRVQHLTLRVPGLDMEPVFMLSRTGELTRQPSLPLDSRGLTVCALHLKLVT
jgi:hypothetical protein